MQWCLRTTPNLFILGNLGATRSFSTKWRWRNRGCLEIVFQNRFLYFCQWIFVKAIILMGFVYQVTWCQCISWSRLWWPFIAILKHLLSCMIATYIPDNQWPAAWGLTYWGVLFLEVPSCKLTWLAGKSPFDVGNTSSNIFKWFNFHWDVSLPECLSFFWQMYPSLKQIFSLKMDGWIYQFPFGARPIFHGLLRFVLGSIHFWHVGNKSSQLTLEKGHIPNASVVSRHQDVVEQLMQLPLT